MRPAEIGGRRLLAGRDDAAADRAGAREEIEERVAVAPADRPLQRGQILGEAAEHLEHRLAIVEEDVAPHRRVGRGDAGEIAEAAGGELHHLRLGDGLEIGGGADDVVGDEMRHVAGDGEHEIVVLRRHHLDIGAERAPEGRERLDGGRIGAGRRRQDAPAVLEEFGEAGVGPGIFGAGDRMGRHEMNALRQMRAHLRDHRRP